VGIREGCLLLLPLLNTVLETQTNATKEKELGKKDRNPLLQIMGFLHIL
jgi:hypothetical protein